MRAQLWKTLDRLRRSYWFLPALMSLLACCLSAGLLWVDAQGSFPWLKALPLLAGLTAEGMRALLQTIAGSMITVAGVTFSITVAAVATSSSQYGPRLMTNFMDDRGNQITLGVFVATFVYCLAVLLGMGDVSAGEGDREPLPRAAILGAVLLTLGSLGVLIYYIHHVPESIHISTMVTQTGRSLLAKIRHHYPKEGEVAATAEAGEAAAGGHGVRARMYGYLQHIDLPDLRRIAGSRGCRIDVTVVPGEFIFADHEICRIYGDEAPSKETQSAVRACFIAGERRTPSQDLLFLVDQLVEVAAVALSPGKNDPFTACHCVDWIAAGIGELMTRQDPNPWQGEENSAVGVCLRTVSLPDFIHAGFTQLYTYAAQDKLVSAHVVERLGMLIAGAEDERQRAQLHEELRRYSPES